MKIQPVGNSDRFGWKAVDSAYISGLVGMPDKLFVGFGGKL